MLVAAFRLTSIFPRFAAHTEQTSRVTPDGFKGHVESFLGVFGSKTLEKMKGLIVRSCVSSSLLYAFYKSVSIRQSYSGFRQFSL